MKTKQTLKKKLNLKKDTITDLNHDDLKQIKGGRFTDFCARSENPLCTDLSECTDAWMVCCW